MARKVFMSVLGTGFYDECSYYLSDPVKSFKTRYVQEAAVRFMCSDWNKEDSIIIFTTNNAFDINYSKEVVTRKNRNGENEAYPGLESILKNLELKTPFKNVHIEDGNTVDEIWSIFDSIYGELNEDDEIYFDITHSFRYLPLLLLILLNYSEFLKKTKIKSITYGNFEVSKSNNGLAPIMDLMPLIILKDWALAVNNFERFGDVKMISELCQTSLKPILSNSKGKDLTALSINNFSKDLPKFIKSIQTCRGNEIIKGETACSLFNRVENIQKTSLAAFNPIFSRLKASIQRFNSSGNIQNGFAAVDWCINNGLIQQGLTLLQETIISLVCESENLEYSVEINRNIVSSSFNIKKFKRPENEWSGLCKKSGENISLTYKLLDNYLIILLVDEFNGLTTQRNDINHAGMKEGSASADSFEKNLKEMFCQVTGKIVNL